MSTKKIIKEIILERNPEAIFLNEKFDKAIIGSGQSSGREYVAAYDSDKCIEILSENKAELEAYECFQAYMKNDWKNKNDPIFISDFTKIKEIDFPDMTKGMTLDDML